MPGPGEEAHSAISVGVSPESATPGHYAILINSLRGGGAERQVSRLAQNLPPRQICLLEAGQDYEVGPVPVVILSESIPPGRVSRTLSVPFLAKRLARYPSPVVLSFLERSNFVNIVSRAFFPHVAVISERVHPSRHYAGKAGKIQLALIRHLYPHAHFIVTNSQATANDLVNNLELSPAKIRVIPNMLDVPAVQALAREPLPADAREWYTHPVVVTSGRLTEQKGTWHLIRAFADLKRRAPDVKLVLLGQGPLEGYLQALARQLGVAKDVHLAGFQQNPHRFVANAALFVLPSLWEGLPNVLIEAMACGVPVLSTDCPAGPREILDGTERLERQAGSLERCQYGVLVPTPSGRKHLPDTPLEPAERAMAAAMELLLSSRSLARDYGKRAAGRARDYAPEAIVPLWRRLLDEARAMTGAPKTRPPEPRPSL